MSPLQHAVAAGLDGDRPLYPGAVALVMRDGTCLDRVALGDAVRYGPGAHVLPPEQRRPMRPDTVFDIASLSKLFTAATTLALVEKGELELDAPVATRLEEFADGTRDAVTLRALLTHTSGLPAVLRLWELPTRADRVAAVLSCGLQRPPGSEFEYSCVGYIVAGLLLERVTGRSLPELVHRHVTEPLRLHDTGYQPTGELAARAAATEDQPYVARGMVRAGVHDENNWSLGGAAGNAGVFSTVDDLARFGEMLRRGGELDGVRVLTPETVRMMTIDQLPPAVDPGHGQGLGPRVDDASFMGSLATHGAFGHTGFTGTSLVVDPELGTVTVLLTNRVHPSREWSDISAVRRDVADLTATLPAAA